MNMHMGFKGIFYRQFVCMYYFFKYKCIAQTSQTQQKKNVAHVFIMEIQCSEKHLHKFQNVKFVIKFQNPHDKFRKKTNGQMKIFRDVHRTVCRLSRRDVKNPSLYVLLKKFIN